MTHRAPSYKFLAFSEAEFLENHDTQTYSDFETSKKWKKAVFVSIFMVFFMEFILYHK